MLSGRCEQTIGNNPGEIEAITAAARSFLKSELEVSSLLLPSLEFQLAAAASCYSQAARLQEEAGRPQLAAGLHTELAEAMTRMRRPLEALPHHQRAAALSADTDILMFISAKLAVAACHITSADYHNALLALTEVANFVAEHDPLHLFEDVQEDVEILRVLLLLIIEPSSHNTDPHLLSVLEKYRVLDDSFEVEAKVSPHISVEVSILLQSLVLSCDSLDTSSVLYIEDELVPLLTDQQRSLLRVVVTQTLRKV